MDSFLFFFSSVRPIDFTTIVKGLVYLMKLLIWEVFDGCSIFFFFLDPLRKDIEKIQKNWSMGIFRPGMTSSKLLRNNIHHKIRVITLVAVVCLKHFSNEATALFA